MENGILFLQILQQNLHNKYKFLKKLRRSIHKSAGKTQRTHNITSIRYFLLILPFLNLFHIFTFLLQTGTNINQKIRPASRFFRRCLTQEKAEQQAPRKGRRILSGKILILRENVYHHRLHSLYARLVLSGSTSCRNEGTSYMPSPIPPLSQ